MSRQQVLHQTSHRISHTTYQRTGSICYHIFSFWSRAVASFSIAYYLLLRLPLLVGEAELRLRLLLPTSLDDAKRNSPGMIKVSSSSSLSRLLLLLGLLLCVLRGFITVPAGLRFLNIFYILFLPPQLLCDHDEHKTVVSVVGVIHPQPLVSQPAHHILPPPNTSIPVFCCCCGCLQCSISSTTAMSYTISSAAHYFNTGVVLHVW